MRPVPTSSTGLHRRLRARRVAWLILLLTLLVAFGLRAYHLDFQSLWTDEGRSWIRATVPLNELGARTPLEHMPTYFALLHFWLNAAGQSDFALRFVSLWASVLAIALTYRLGADLGSRRAGLIAAVFLATANFQVWYAQEARMYTLMLATSLAATWLLWRMITRWSTAGIAARDGAAVATALFPRDRRFYLTFAGYVLAVAATIYLHFYGLFLPVSHVVIMAAWALYRRDRRALLRWALAGCAVLALYLPAVPRLLGMTSYSGWPRSDFSAAQLPWRFFTAYTTGDTMPQPWRAWLPWVYALLLLAGIVAWRRIGREAALMLVCSAFVPIAGTWAMTLSQPQFHERYTLLVTAPLLLLIAAGFEAFDARFWRAAARRGAGPRVQPILTAAGGLLLAGLLAANAMALARLYNDDSLHKADYRAAARFVMAEELPGDVILADDSTLPETFQRYYEGDAPAHDLTYIRFPSTDDQIAAARDALAGARRVWTLDHSGGNTPITQLMLREGWLADEFDDNGVRVDLFGLPSLGQRSLPAGMAYGPNLTLSGVDLLGAGEGSEPPAFSAGDMLGVTTRWQVTDALPSLKFSLRLVDATGRKWAGADYAPINGLVPTESWQPGQSVEDRRGLRLPADLPPGAYDLLLLLYDPASGAALPEGEPGGHLLTRIEVMPAATPPALDALPLPTRAAATFGNELELLGYGIDPDPARAESGATLSLWWRVKQTPADGQQVEALIGSGEAIAGRGVAALRDPTSPAWQPGQIVRQHVELAFDPAAPSGKRDLRLTLLDAAGNATGASVAVGQAQVEARPRVYRLPRMGERVDARLGAAITLAGYTLAPPEKAGDHLTLTLYWQASERVTGAYKVFVHVVDAAGNLVSQQDSMPAAGAAPTQSWLKGEVVADEHIFPIPAGGDLRVYVGLYDPVSGARLPVVDGGGRPVESDALRLAEFSVR